MFVCVCGGRALALVQPQMPHTSTSTFALIFSGQKNRSKQTQAASRPPGHPCLVVLLGVRSGVRGLVQSTTTTTTTTTG